MSNAQKLKDAVVEFANAKKDLTEKVNKAAIEAEKTRQEQVESPTHRS